MPKIIAEVSLCTNVVQGCAKFALTEERRVLIKDAGKEDIECSWEEFKHGYTELSRIMEEQGLAAPNNNAA